MDKNTTTGIVLLIALMIGFFYVNKPTEEQLKARKHYQDSIEALAKNAELEAQVKNQDSVLFEDVTSDSLRQVKLKNEYGDFSSAMVGENSFVALKNNLISANISTKGGNVSKVELLNYKTFDGKPLILFDGESESQFSLLLDALGLNKNKIHTSDLYFKTKSVSENSVTLSLEIGSSSIDFIYTLPNDSYMMNFDIKTNNLNNVLKESTQIDLLWEGKIRQQEKGHKFENRYAALYFLEKGESVDYLSETTNDSKLISNDLKWVAFKDQFFSSIFIAENSIVSADLNSIVENDSSKYLKSYSAKLVLPINTRNNDTYNYKFFFGPNQYKLLKSYDADAEGDKVLNLKKIVPLGWSIVRWVNQLVVIPLFNFLGSFINSYGLIIFLLTLFVKLVLFPLSYKSFLSTAKMRVLKPELDKELAKIPESNQMERQQAQMEMYKKTGVNPMGGCLPMLLQMPVLIALFYFFPTSIELRQQSFLWANDLSAYDAIFSWTADIPIISYLFDNHISLFCLLMTLANVASTKINMSVSDTGQQQMPGMKYMMYFMPIMFLFIFNNYASGLCYYYLLSTLFTLLQTIAIRKFVDEEKLLLQLKENSKKPQKSSAWMNRILELQKQASEQQKLQQNKK